MIEKIVLGAGLAVVLCGAIGAVGCLAVAVANIWMYASRKWRTIFRAENNILDYIQHRREFERWKKGQEALKDDKGDD